MKTYSVCLRNPYNVWITNWGQYDSKDDIDFDNVKAYCIDKGYTAYGVMHGHNSRDLTSPHCREILWRA